MSDLSIFPDKTQLPDMKALSEVLGDKVALWEQLHSFILSQYPQAVGEWNFPGKKYGWSYRLKDKKRAIMYFLPREGYFKAAFVYGQKAFDAVMASEVSGRIKTDLAQATKYAEGRGVSIIVDRPEVIADIERLICIKLDN